MKHFTMIVAALAVIATAGHAQAKSGRMSMDALEPTGETENCLRTYQIHETKVIDKSTILFRMNGNEYYVNRLPNRCSGLRLQGGFAYTIRGLNQLCSTDSIRVINTATGDLGQHCPLGKFEKLKQKEE